MTRAAIHAFKWSMLGEIVAAASGPLVFLALARLLVPADFGVMAAATIVISISQVVCEAGMREALIQRQTRVEESATIAFWLNLRLALVIMVVLLVGAAPLADFFHDPRIAPVVRVLSLQILLAASSAVHTALLQKELQFRRLFWVRLLSTTLPAAASIPLAVHGLGYWALVAGAIAGQAVQAVVLWRLSAWRPRRTLDRELARELVAFGKWATLTGLLGWFYLWMDAVVVGRYLSSHELGLYRTGNTFVTLIVGLIFAPLLPVLYSVFSLNQHDQPRLREALETVTHAIALVALPVGGFLHVSGDAVAAVFFGPQWRGLGEVISILALVHGVAWIVGANGEMYRAIGKPHVETWTMAVMLVVYLCAYLISIRHGLRFFLHIRLSLAILAFFVHVAVARVVLNVPFSRWWHIRALLIAVTSAAAASVADVGTKDSFTQLAFRSVVFVAVALAGVVLFERPFAGRLLAMMRGKGDSSHHA